MRMVVQCAAWLLLLAAVVTCELGAQQQAMQMATAGNVATTAL